MGTAITPVAPGTKVLTALSRADVALRVGEPRNVYAMTRAASREAISITPSANESVTVAVNEPGNVTASGPGSIACGGSISFASTGLGSVAALSVGNVTIGADGPTVESTGSNPQPDENYPYTIYAPAGTVVQFCDNEGRVLSSTTAV